MSKKCGTNLTGGMVVTTEMQTCFSFTDATGCMQQGIKTVTPNPADPENPIVVYTLNGVVIPKPDNVAPCLEPGVTQPVFIMGGKLTVEPLPAPEIIFTDVESYPYCNPDTDTIWVRAIIYSIASGVATEIELSNTDTMVACGEQPPQVDITKVEYCNQATGTNWLQICKHVTDVDGNTVTTVLQEQDLGTTCVKVCEPAISEVFGETTTPTEFTAIAVNNPKCCDVLVTTSAGTFTVTKNECGLSEHFDCVVTLESIAVTGDCDPATVHTILTKRF